MTPKRMEEIRACVSCRAHDRHQVPELLDEVDRLEAALADARTPEQLKRTAQDKNDTASDPESKVGFNRNKYTVTRNDGSSDSGWQPGDGYIRPPGKHAKCEYFVLDLHHDKFSVPALIAYAAACDAEYPALAADVRAKLITFGHLPASPLRDANQDAACRAFGVKVLNELEERRADSWSSNDAKVFFALRDAVERGTWPPKEI